MNALAIIEAATAEGLVVGLAPGGSLKAIGEQEVVNRWRPLLKQHKDEIINLLATVKPGGGIEATRPTLPSWCTSRCEHFHKLVVPDLGTLLWCCQEEDSTHWRRLRIDTMNSCPMEEVAYERKQQAAPTREERQSTPAQRQKYEPPTAQPGDPF